MNYLKPVIAGILFGAAVFFLPFFILRIAAFMLIIGLSFRLFAGYRLRGWGYSNLISFADNIRTMSDEDYARYRQNFNAGCSWQGTPRSSQTETKAI